MVENSQQEQNSVVYYKKRIFQILSPKTKEPLAYLSIVLITFATITSVLMVILETERKLFLQYRLVFIIFEGILGSIFIAEYILRVWSNEINPDSKMIKNTQLQYIISPLGIIDLVCVISFILGFIFPFEVEWRNAIRLLRLAVLFKSMRYIEALNVILAVIKRKRQELILTFLFSMILLFFAAVFILIAEHDAQPDKFTNLFSAMYWAGVTMFTIGYGDLYPITPLGKIIAGVVAFIGITLFLLPASVISSGFIDEMQERYPHYDYCPNCKKQFVESKALKDITRSRKYKNLAQIEEPVIEVNESDPYGHIKVKFYNFLENKYPTTLEPKIFNFAYLIFIGFIAFTIMLETNPVLSQEFRPVLIAVYLISAVLFSTEYVIRLWICPLKGQQKYPDTIHGRLKYAETPLAIVDLIVLSTFYFQLLFSFAYSIEFIGFVVLRLLVLFKIGHLTDMFNVIWDVFKEYFEEFLTTIYLCILFLIYCSTIMYGIEHDVQPDKFSSILTTLYWSIMTFTTVGYGDVYAITTAGHFFTVLFAFAGVALFTLPAGIFGASFFSSMKKFRLHKVCPKCGFLLSKPKIK